MNIQANYPLSQLTTFHLGGPAKYYCKVANIDELGEALDFARGKNLPILILGGGSNMLVADRGFAGLVVQVDVKGIELIDDSIKVGAGEIWDDVVVFAMNNNLWGMENLSNIPGLTGAIPIQNVGAYGQEASQIVKEVEVFNLRTSQIKIVNNEECGFGYRKSHFNTDWKNQFVILSVTFQLSKIAKPNLTYVDVKKYFGEKINPTIAEIREAIIEIRKKKFPNLSEFGTAGSFFKNLILSQRHYDTLVYYSKQNFSEETVAMLEEIKTKFPIKQGIKIPSAFLIDICGLKGKSAGGARLWEKQALVIVTSSGAKSSDVLELYNQVKAEVLAKTGMTLEPEPELVGFNI